MAIELEYAEMLYALVLKQRPGIVMETGAGRGIASTFLAQALADCGPAEGNEGRWLYTFEHEPQYQALATRALRGLPATVLPYVWSPEHTLSLHEGCPSPDIVFIDSISPYRIPELDFWLTTGRQDITLVVHDSNRDYGLDRAEGIYFRKGDGLWIGRARPE